MKIREANKFDLPEVIAMLRNFRMQTPIDTMKECNNEEHINMLFHHVILGGGISFVAEKDTKLVGIIIGIKDHNIFDPDLTMLKELVFWVEKEHRGSSAGYKLIKSYNKALWQLTISTSYNKKAQELVDEKEIIMYTMTKMVNSPDLDFSRFGYKKLEEVWVAGV